MKDKNKKVKFTYYDLEGNLAVESLWAEKEGDFYRIKNIPFFAPNIAFNDLVSVEDDKEELYFNELISPSGHSTIQVIIFNEENIDQITSKISSFHCDWEGSHIKGYISIDVPENVPYLPLKDYLQKKNKDGILDYKEACLAHKMLE